MVQVRFSAVVMAGAILVGCTERLAPVTGFPAAELEPSANFQPQGAADLSCPHISLGLAHLRTFDQSTTITFGGLRQTFANLYPQAPWLFSSPPQTSNYWGHYRQFGGEIVSNDCGRTWTTTGARVPPLQLTRDGADAIADGVNHITFDISAGFFSRGFMTNIQWNRWDRSRIYPVFQSSFPEGWAYQALTETAGRLTAPNPVIGNPDIEVPDHFYSPSVVVNYDDPERSVQLFFGGWRGRPQAIANAGQCRGDYGLPGPGATTGPLDKDCRCPLYIPGVTSPDACSGDKIFVATNRRSATGSTNKLFYKVHSGASGFTAPAWDSAQFEPIIWPALLNQTCSVRDCPFKLVHTNDPGVARLPNGNYVVYFTGAPLPADNGVMPAYTHVAVLRPDFSIQSVRILRPGAGVRLPFGLAYNQSNGRVRATLDHTGTRLILTSIATPDHPQVDPSSPDAWKLFVYTVSVDDPSRILSVRKVDANPHELAATPGRVFTSSSSN